MVRDPEAKRWRVGELAAATGVTVRALHHYDELGLLVPGERSAAGHRLYGEADVRRLYRIVALRELGLRLEEIAAVLDRGEPGLTEIIRRQLGRAERELERQQRLRDRLAVMLEILERSREPSVERFIDAMDAMVVICDVVEIARLLGTSRQGASELTATRDFPSPRYKRGGRPVWNRQEIEAWAATNRDRRAPWRPPAISDDRPFSGDVFAVLELAGHEASALNHGWVGDEHVLLALLHPDCPGAARDALRSLGVEREALRDEVIRTLGDGFSTGEHGARLLPVTQYALKRATLKAVELRDERVSGEHVLLGLLDAPEGSRARTLLSGTGVEPAALASRVVGLTDRTPRAASNATVAESVGEVVHAAEVARILGVSRDRVAQLMRVAADFPGSEITQPGHRVWSRTAIEAWAATHADRGPRHSRLQPPAPGTVVGGMDTLLAVAKEEAARMNQPVVRRDHLFLALLRPDRAGKARSVLEQIGLTLEDARRHAQSAGDPPEPNPHEPTVPPATHEVLETATRWAAALEDEQVGDLHVLVALTQEWQTRPRALARARPEIQPAALHDRLMDRTEGMLPVPVPVWKPHWWESEERIPHPPEPELASSPSGRDPRQRQPWSTRAYAIRGRRGSQRQYQVDGDGHAILTAERKLVGWLEDDERRLVLDKQGKRILTAIQPPEGAATHIYPRET